MGNLVKYGATNTLKRVMIKTLEGMLTFNWK